MTGHFWHDCPLFHALVWWFDIYGRSGKRWTCALDPSNSNINSLDVLLLYGLSLPISKREGIFELTVSPGTHAFCKFRNWMCVALMLVVFLVCTVDVKHLMMMWDELEELVVPSLPANNMIAKIPWIPAMWAPPFYRIEIDSIKPMQIPTTCLGLYKWELDPN